MTEDLRLIANGGQYVEVDSLPSSDADGTMTAATANVLTLTAFPANQNYYRYKDFGANFFSERFYAEGSFNLTLAGGASKDLSIIFGDTIGAERQQVNAAGVELYRGGATTTSYQPYALKYESSVVAGSSAGAALTAGTTYYYRIGVLSSLGRYGAVLVDIFSDAARTIRVTTRILQRTVARNYQYFYPASTYNEPAVGTISGTHQDITLFYPTAGIDLTTYSEVDPGGRIAAYADVAVVTALSTNNETAYLYKDYGVGYFAGNYEVRGALNVTAFTSGGGSYMFDLFAFNNALADGNPGGSYAQHAIGAIYLTTTTYQLRIREHYGVTEAVSTGEPTLSTNTPYWVKMRCDTTVGTYGTLYMQIYSDPEYLNQVGATISRTLGAAASFQYLNVVQTYNQSLARSSTFTLGGVVFPPLPLLHSTGDDSTGSAEVVTARRIAHAVIADGSAVGEVVTTHRIVHVAVIDGLTSGDTTASSIPTMRVIVDGSAGGDVLTSHRLTHVAVTDGTVGTEVMVSHLIPPPVTYCRIRRRFLRWNATTQQNEWATGITPMLRLFSPSENLSRDFSDNAMKPHASCVNINVAMVVRDAIYYPEWYDYLLRIDNLGALGKTQYDLIIDVAGDTTLAAEDVIVIEHGEVVSGVTAEERNVLNGRSSAAAVAALPSASQNATAIISASATTPIDADIKKVSGQSIAGAGTAIDPWRPI